MLFMTFSLYPFIVVSAWKINFCELKCCDCCCVNAESDSDFHLFIVIVVVVIIIFGGGGGIERLLSNQ